MDEYIGKGALYDALWDAKEEKKVKSLKDVFTFLDKFPTADVVEVKHGYFKDEYGTCSVCNRNISEIYDADSYMTTDILSDLICCPFCSAKMDGKRKEGAE